MPLKRIARDLGLRHKTVKRWLRAGHAPTWRKPPRPKLIDRYEEHLERRWREGCHNAAQLWRELRDQGFTGKSGTVRLWATRRRRERGEEPAAPAGCPGADKPAGHPAGSGRSGQTRRAPRRDLVVTLINAAPEITASRHPGPGLRRHDPPARG